jgi:hypothetical protein
VNAERSTPSEPSIQIRNLRHLSGRDAVDSVTFGDLDRSHLLTMNRERFERLGEPAYVVVSVRAETFGESTS